MRATLRHLGLCLGALLGLSAMAQYAYTVNLSGHVSPCDPSVAGGTVHLTSGQGSDPAYDLDVPLDDQCGYSISLGTNTPTDVLTVTATCMNGPTSATGTYTINDFLGSADVTIDVACVDIPITCHACMDLRPAIDAFLGTAIPFTVDGQNCSTGVAPFTYIWSWGDGHTDNTFTATHTYDAPGTYNVCLSIVGGDGCMNTICEDVVIADDGTVDPNATEPCHADFWAIQAFDGDPNGVHGDPIPNELWIWNLSSGGSGLFQFAWDFGDGQTSTDAYPTHVYPTGGPYVLCLTITDSENCTSTYCDSLSVDENGMLRDEDATSSGFTINVMHPLAAGIDEAAITNVSTWPNPVTDHLNVALSSRMNGSVPMMIVDPSGRVVMNSARTLTNGSNQLTVPTDALTPGVYVLRIGQGKDASLMRFVKTH